MGGYGVRQKTEVGPDVYETDNIRITSVSTVGFRHVKRRKT